MALIAHDVGRDAGVEALESLLAIGEVVEAAVDVRDLGAVLGHCVAPLRLLLGSGGLGLGALLGGLARSKVSKPFLSIQGMSEASSSRTMWPL